MATAQLGEEAGGGTDRWRKPLVAAVVVALVDEATVLGMVPVDCLLPPP